MERNTDLQDSDDWWKSNQRFVLILDSQGKPHWITRCQDSHRVMHWRYNFARPHLPAQGMQKTRLNDNSSACKIWTAGEMLISKIWFTVQLEDSFVFSGIVATSSAQIPQCRVQRPTTFFNRLAEKGKEVPMRQRDPLLAGPRTSASSTHT